MIELLMLLSLGQVSVETRPANWIAATPAGIVRVEGASIKVEGKCDLPAVNARFLQASSASGRTGFTWAEGRDQGPDLGWFSEDCAPAIPLGPLYGQNPLLIQPKGAGWQVYVMRSPTDYETINLDRSGTLSSVRARVPLPDTSQGFLQVGEGGEPVFTDLGRVSRLGENTTLLLAVSAGRVVAGQDTDQQLRICDVLGGDKEEQSLGLSTPQCQTIPQAIFETTIARTGDADYTVASRGVTASIVAKVHVPLPAGPTPPETVPGPVPAPPPSPDLFELLKALRASYPTPMSKAQIGELLNRVAWAGRTDGWGLLRKPSGNNCPLKGELISCDILVQSKTMEMFDVLADSDNTATPAWGSAGIQPDASRFLGPFEPDGAPVPDPTPIPPAPQPGPTIDLKPILDRLDRLEEGLNRLVDRLIGLDAIKDLVDQLRQEQDRLRSSICGEREIELGIRVLGTAHGRILGCKES